MRLLKLEIKRMLKTKMTLILLLSTFLLSFVMAYLPVTYSYCGYRDADGNIVKLTGLASVRYLKELQADIAGDVTPEKLRRAVEEYQACLTGYGVTESYDLPEGVYQTEILPYAPLLRGIKEAFADPDTGIAASIMEINPRRLDDFYHACDEHMAALMRIEQSKHPAAQDMGISLYSKVEKPFRFYPGYNSDAMDYQMLLGFLILLFCTAITASVFTSDYQTGADDILRCTKYGKVKFALTKITSALLICGTAYSVCTLIYIIVSDCLFGWECTKTSMQILFSIVNLPNMDLGQLQVFTAVSGLLCIMATTSFTLFLSSRIRNMSVSMSAALLFGILPIIVYMALPAELGIWIYGLLPAGGLGLQTSILYSAIDFYFWNIGNIAIWLPYGMIGAYIAEIPLFAGLAIRSYTAHVK